jgi:hypothetical protein
MPVHTYYTSSRSWLVPVIKARLTDAAAVAQCRPVCIGSVRERVLTGAIVTANTDNLREVYLPQQLGFHQIGCEIAPMIVRLHLEEEPEHAAIKLDNEGHFNMVMRHAALQFCASRPNQEPPEYAREIPPTHGGAEKDGTGVSGLGPSARQGTTHGRTFRPHHRVAVVVEPWDGQDHAADST